MSLASIARRPYSNLEVVRMLMSACIVLYLLVFGVLYLYSSANGTSFETVIGLGGPETSDVTEYVHLAENLLGIGRFEISPAYGPEFLRVPGYPLFLALLLALFQTLTVVPLIQMFFTAATGALIYLTGVRYFPRSIALAAAFVYLIDPVVIYATWVPISESLFMLFFIASIYALGFPARRKWLPFLAAGILFAASIYMRPVGLYLAPLIALMIVAHTATWKETVRYALLFLVTVLLLLVPWMFRNYTLSGQFSFSSGGAYNLYAANLPIFEQARTGISYEQIRRDNNLKYFGTDEEDILRSFKYADEQARIAKEVIFAHPVEYGLFHTAKSMQLFVGSSIVNAKYHLYKLGILAGEPPHGEGAWGMLLQGRWGDALVQTFTHLPRLVERLLWLAVYIGMLYTTYRAVRYRSAATPWIISAFLLIHAIAFMTGPSSDDTRYRMPLEPFLLLLGISGLASIAVSTWKRFLARPQTAH